MMEQNRGTDATVANTTTAYRLRPVAVVTVAKE